jgi:hypothetical protein
MQSGLAELSRSLSLVLPCLVAAKYLTSFARRLRPCQGLNPIRPDRQGTVPRHGQLTANHGIQRRPCQKLLLPPAAHTPSRSYPPSICSQTPPSQPWPLFETFENPKKNRGEQRSVQQPLSCPACPSIPAPSAADHARTRASCSPRSPRTPQEVRWSSRPTPKACGVMAINTR